MTRHDITFPSGKENCAAWLYLPATNTPAPIIVMGHGLGGVREMRLDAFAERLCGAGYACLVFDYRHFGASEGQPRQLLSIRKQLDDWHAAIAYAKTESRVDAKQIIAWGSSFGGGLVLSVAAKSSDVAGVVSQCPFTNGLSSMLALNPLSAIRVGTLGVLDVLTQAFKREPITVPLANTAGKTGLMTAPDALKGYQQLLTSDTNFKNEVAARFGLQIGYYYPGHACKHILCPTLVIACLKDSVAPVKPTLRHAKTLPQGTVIELDTGHFDIYIGEWFEKNVAIQIEWLHKHFPVS